MTDWSKAEWRKSTISDSGACVEVASADGLVGVRDTKAHGTGPVLEFTRLEWMAFLGGVQQGEFSPERLGL